MKNKSGGGGDTFRHIFLGRQGEYGDHKTSVGKIVYQRPRHFFSSADISRVMLSVAQKSDEDPTLDDTEKLNWFWRSINWLADYMLQRMVGWLGISDHTTKLFWDWIMSTWLRWVNKAYGPGGNSETVARIFQEQYLRGLEQYRITGDTAGLSILLDKLLLPRK